MTLDASGREDLLKALWLEKSGRRPLTRDEALAGVDHMCMYIALPGPDVSLYDVGDGILDACIEYPERGSEWSSTWGRTLVVTDGTLKLSANFGRRISERAWNVAPVRTTATSDPERWLQGVGRHTSAALDIALCDTGSYRIEALVLQMERMIEAFLWQRALQLARQHGYSLSEAYGASARECKQRGIRLSLVPEAELLDHAAAGCLVRIYGDVLRERTLPSLVGAITNVSRDREEKAETTYVCDRTSPDGGSRPLHGRLGTKRRRRGECDRNNRAITTDRANQAFRVICGLTLLKHLHAGSLLHVAQADLVRAALGSDALYVEGNDIGARVGATVDRLATTAGMAPDEVVQRLAQAEITADQVDEAYRNRCVDRLVGFSTSRRLLETRTTSPFEPIHLIRRRELTDAGFRKVVVFADLELHDELAEVLAGGQRWAGLGFSYVTDSKGKVHVLESVGHPTTTAVRTAACLRVSRIQAPRPVIYVDAMKSVQATPAVAEALGAENIIATEGAGLSIDGRPASGTNGIAPDLAEIEQRLRASGVSASLRDVSCYFLLTRYGTLKAATASSGTDNPSNIQESYFDYHTSEDFLADFVGAGLELSESLDLTNAEYRGDSRAEWTGNRHRTDAALRRAKAVLARPDQLTKWPACQAQRVDLLGSFGTAHRWIHQVVTGIPPDVVDEHVARTLAQGARTIEEVAELAGLPLPSRIPAGLKQRSSWPDCVYVRSLTQRGYRTDTDKFVERLSAYLAGRERLVKRRFWVFEDLRRIIEALREPAISHDDHNRLKAAARLCLLKLGFSGV